MSIKNVHAVLQSAVADIAGLPTLQRENTRNTNQQAAWSRFSLLPAETSQATLGDTGKERLNGLAQIDIFTPVDTGVTTALTKAELILAAFPRGTELTISGQIVRIDRCWVETASQDGKHYHTPVQIRWHSLVVA